MAKQKYFNSRSSAPRGENKPAQKRKKKDVKMANKIIYRSAVTGKFVKEGYAKKHSIYCNFI